MWCSSLLVLHLRQRCSDGIYFRTKCVDDNECSRTPCLNGGTCVNNVGSYKCSCTGGFVGTNCENDVDECVKSKPCQNSAVCTNNKGSVVVVYYALLFIYVRNNTLEILSIFHAPLHGCEKKSINLSACWKQPTNQSVSQREPVSILEYSVKRWNNTENNLTDSIFTEIYRNEIFRK